MASSDKFIWAVGSSATQIEGGYDEDGRSESMWDAIRKEPGRIKDAPTPDMSCDGRKKWKEDVQLLKNLGVSHYRFSIDWARVMPDGRTRNAKGMEFYKRLCEELLKNGIEPMVSLWQADAPLPFAKAGSWLRQEADEDFVQLARYCFEELGPMVRTWFTLHEIPMWSWQGVVKTRGMPYQSIDIDHTAYVGSGASTAKAALTAGKNMLLAHAKTFRLYKDEFAASQKGRIGLIAGQWPIAGDEPGSKEACERAFLWLFCLHLDPILGSTGDWSSDAKSLLGDDLPPLSQAEQKLLNGSTDFLGLNWFRPFIIGPKGEEEPPTLLEEVFDFRLLPDSWEKISGPDAWPRLCPSELLPFLRYISSLPHAVPTLITESGCEDMPGAHPLEDENRIRYLNETLKVVAQARAEGLPLLGFTAWSLMDCFEFSEGFTMKYGLHHVDFERDDKPRTPKRSALFYKRYIEDHPNGPSVE